MKYRLTVEFETPFGSTIYGEENLKYTAEFATFTDHEMLASLNSWLKKIAITQIDQSEFAIHILDKAIRAMTTHGDGSIYGTCEWRNSRCDTYVCTLWSESTED